MSEPDVTFIDEKKPFYIYVAGPLSDMPGDYLANVGRIAGMSRHLLGSGFCTINPAADLLDGILSAVPLSVETYQRRSRALLRLLEGKRAAVFVTSQVHRDGRRSRGVEAEINLAHRLHIPVLFSFGQIGDWKAKARD